MHAIDRLIEQARAIGDEPSRQYRRSMAVELVKQLANLYPAPGYGTGATAAERARVHVRAAVIMGGDTPEDTDAEAAAYIPEIVTDLMELLGQAQDRARQERTAS